eukprot:5286267-Alexandrium_andersonii.AAC.1
MDIQATPIRAWWAANQQVRPARGDETDRPLTVAREATIPRLASQAGAQVQRARRGGPVPGPAPGHRCDA